jgi:hypothetical protein
MTGIKVLGAGAFMAVADATTSLPMGSWEKLGVVGIALLAVIALWNDSKKQREIDREERMAREERDKKMIETVTTALSHNSDVISRCEHRP